MDVIPCRPWFIYGQLKWVVFRHASEFSSEIKAPGLAESCPFREWSTQDSFQLSLNCSSDFLFSNISFLYLLFTSGNKTTTTNRYVTAICLSVFLDDLNRQPLQNHNIGTTVFSPAVPSCCSPSWHAEACGLEGLALQMSQSPVGMSENSRPILVMLRKHHPTIKKKCHLLWGFEVWEFWWC